MLLKKIEYLLIVCVLLLVPFQNTSLQEYGGILFSSPAVFFLLLLFPFHINRLLNFHYTAIVVVGVVFVVWGGYFIFYSQEYGFWFLMDRGFRFSLLWGIYIFAFFIGTRIDSEMLRLVALPYLIVILSGTYLSYSGYLDSVSFFHYADNINMRPRGFTNESSSFGVHIFILTCLIFSSFVNNSGRFSYFVLAFAAALSLLSLSKGAVVAGLLACASPFLLRSDWTIKILGSAVLVVVFALVIPAMDMLSLSFDNDLRDSYSTATRLTMAILSVGSIYNIFGVGPFGYLPYIYENIDNSISLAQAYLPIGANFLEVYSYSFRGATESVGAKSIFFDGLIFFGFLFVLLAAKISRDVYLVCKKNNNILNFGLFVFCMVASIFYFSSLGDYILPLVFGYLYKAVVTPSCKAEG